MEDIGNTGVVEQPEVVQPEAAAQPTDTGVESVSPAEVNESTITPEVVEKQPSEAEAGQIAAIKAEREKRQAMEQRARILEQEVNELRQRQTPQQPQQKNPFDGFEDEDLVNVKAVKEFITSRDAATEQKLNMMKINQSTMFAKMKYSDFDEVIPSLQKVANQAQIGYILASDNPAETAYLFIKASPQYINSLTKETVEKTAQQTIDQISRHSNKVKTLSGSGAGSTKKESRFKTMNDDEFNKVQAAVMMGNQSVIDQYFK